MRAHLETALTCLASSIGGIVVYSGLFLLLIRMTFIRHLADSAGQESHLTAEVVLASLTCVITLTGVASLLLDRNLAGRFFFIAMIVGIFLIALATPLYIHRNPQPPGGLDRFIVAGLLVGNGVTVISNISAFFFKLPSV